MSENEPLFICSDRAFPAIKRSWQFAVGSKSKTPPYVAAERHFSVFLIFN